MADVNVKVNLEARDAELTKALNDWQKGIQGGAEKLNKLLGGNEKFVKELEIKIDDTGAVKFEATSKRVLTGIQKIEREAKKLQKVEIGSVTNLRQSLNNAKQLRDSIRVLGTTIDRVSGKPIIGPQVNAGFLAANARVRELTQQLRQVEAVGQTPFQRIGNAIRNSGIVQFGQGVQNLVGVFQSLSIAISAILRPINEANRTLAKLQSFSLSFRAIGVEATQSNAALEDASRIALGLGTSIDTVRAGYQKLSPVILATGGNLGDVSGVLESLSSRFAAFGLNADQSRRVLNGVIQAFAKGKLQAEELTQQISEADPAFKVDFVNAINASQKALDALGVKSVDGVAALEELVKAGKVTADVLVPAIKGIGKQAVVFDKLGTSAKSAFEAIQSGQAFFSQLENQFNNLNQLSFERLVKAFEPALLAIKQLQAVFIDFFTTLSKSRVVKDLASVIGSLVSAIAGAGETIGSVSGIFLGFVDAISAIVSTIGGVIGGITSLGGALDDFGGPLELIVGVLGLKLGAILIQSAKNFVKFALEVQRSSKQVAKAFKEVQTQEVINKTVIPKIKQTVVSLNNAANAAKETAASNIKLAASYDAAAAAKNRYNSATVADTIIPDPFDPDERGTAITVFDPDFARQQEGALKNLKDRTDDLANGYNNARKNAEALGNQRFRAPSVGISLLNTKVQEGSTVFGQLRVRAARAFDAVKRGAAKAGGAVVSFARSATNALANFISANKGLILLAAGLKLLTSVTDAYNDLNQRTSQGANAINDAIGPLNQSLSELGDKYRKLSQQQRGLFDKGAASAKIFGREISGFDIVFNNIARGIQAIDFAGIFKEAESELNSLSRTATTAGDRIQAAIGAGAVAGFTTGGLLLAVKELGLGLVGAGKTALATGPAFKVTFAVAATAAVIAAASVNKFNEALKQVGEESAKTFDSVDSAVVTLRGSIDSLEPLVNKIERLKELLASTTNKQQAIKIRAELTTTKAELQAKVDAIQGVFLKVKAQFDSAELQRKVQQDLLTIAEKIGASESFRIEFLFNTEQLKDNILGLAQDLADSDQLGALEIALGNAVGEGLDFSSFEAFKESLETVDPSQLEAIGVELANINDAEPQLADNLKKTEKEANAASRALKKIGQDLKDLENVDTPPAVVTLKKDLADAKARAKAANAELQTLGVDYQVPESIEKLRTIVQGLAEDEKIIRMNANIVQAEQALAQLDQIIDQIRQEGETPINISVQINQVQTLQSQTPIGSQLADSYAQQLEDLTNRRNFGLQTSDQLRQTLFNNEITRLQSLQAAESRRSQAVLDNLDREIAAARRYWDEKLQQVEDYVGPATKKLQELKEAELKEQAKENSRRGLEAKAQLEAIEKAKRLAEIRKKAAEDLKKREEQRRIAAEKAQRREEAFQNKIVALQEAANAIQQEALDRQNQIIEEILRKREEDGKIAERTAINQKDAAQDTNKAVSDSIEKAKTLDQKFKDAVDGVESLGEALGNIDDKVAAQFEGVVGQIEGALTGLGSQLDNVFSKTYSVTVRLNVIGGAQKKGGPVMGGVTYTVNEAGQEAFLSASGKLSPIKKAAFSKFTPKEDGLIIPHHIWKEIKGEDQPSIGPRKSPSVKTMPQQHVQHKDNSAQILSAALASMNYSNQLTRNAHQESNAAHARELGKLNKSIKQLVKKDWNLHTTVRAPGYNRTHNYGAIF